MHEAKQGLLEGTMSAQKALLGSKMETTELLGGTVENRGIIDLSSRQINDFFTYLTNIWLCVNPLGKTQWRYLSWIDLRISGGFDLYWFGESDGMKMKITIVSFLSQRVCICEVFKGIAPKLCDYTTNTSLSPSFFVADTSLVCSNDR